MNKFSHDMFSGGSCPAAAPVQQAGEEAEATSEYFMVLNGIRVRRATEYYQEEATMNELAVLTMVLDTSDHLLYAMLGGSDRKGPPCKVAEFLDRDTSLVGKCSADFMRLLDSLTVELLRAIAF